MILAIIIISNFPNKLKMILLKILIIMRINNKNKNNNNNRFYNKTKTEVRITQIVNKIDKNIGFSIIFIKILIYKIEFFSFLN